jgi:hypothetical protein
MPGSNFDDMLSISGGHVVPPGPLGLANGETDIKVYAWVTQHKSDGTSAACAAEKSYSNIPSDHRWKADSSMDNYGTFVAGSAVGTAMAIFKKNNQMQVYWWSEDIQLQ